MSTRDHPDWLRPVAGPNSIDSILERRSIIGNSGVTPAWFGLAAAQRYGKFFPRGCRGFITNIEVYCQDAGVAGGTVTVYITPIIGMGPLYQANIVVPIGGAPAWRAAAFNLMWNYDSLFIFVELTLNIQCGRDLEVLSPDAHISGDFGATWAISVWRPWYRGFFIAETPGDVPVSGIINNIPIPNMSSRFLVEDQAIEVMVPLEVIRIDGAGYVDLVVARVNAAANSDHTYVQVECDGNIAMDMTFVYLNLYGFNDDTQPLSIPQYAEDGACTMMITKKFEFRRLFRVLCLNNLGAQIVHVYVYPNLMR